MAEPSPTLLSDVELGTIRPPPLPNPAVYTCTHPPPPLYIKNLPKRELEEGLDWGLVMHGARKKYTVIWLPIGVPASRLRLYDEEDLL